MAARRNRWVLGLLFTLGSGGVAVAENEPPQAEKTAEEEAVEHLEALAADTRHRGCDRLARSVKAWNAESAVRLAELTRGLDEKAISELDGEHRRALDERLSAAFTSIGQAVVPCADHEGTIEAFAETQRLLIGQSAEEASPWGAQCTLYFSEVERLCTTVLTASDEAGACERLRTTVSGLRDSGANYGPEMASQLEPVCEQSLGGLSVIEEAYR